MSATASYPQPLDFFKLLAHEIRWNILSLLRSSDYCVQELSRLLGQPQNLVSYHLKQLRAHHIVTERRSAADSRDIYYSLDFETLQMLYATASDTLHPALRRTDIVVGEAIANLPGTSKRVLFLCTHNSARSQMAEGLLRHYGGDRFEVFSAGTEATFVRPLAIKAMAELDIDISHQESKTLNRYLAEPFDEVITVCDAAAEACPVFPGARYRRHWSLEDPSKAAGREEEQLAVYRRVRDALRSRIERELLTGDKILTSN